MIALMKLALGEGQSAQAIDAFPAVKAVMAHALAPTFPPAQTARLVGSEMLPKFVPKKLYDCLFAVQRARNGLASGTVSTADAIPISGITVACLPALLLLPACAEIKIARQIRTRDVSMPRLTGGQGDTLQDRGWAAQLNAACRVSITSLMRRRETEGDPPRPRKMTCPSS
jgi:hypothetical protein